MIKGLINRDIVIIGQQPWDTEIGSNCKDIALELSKNNRVLYVNSPLDRITKFRGRKNEKIKKRIDIIEGKIDGLVFVKDNLWNFYPNCILESVNWINDHSVFNWINKINNKRSAKSITNAITKLSFKKIILFNDNEMFKGFYLKEFLKPVLSIYYSRDFMLGVEYWRKHGLKLEPKLMEKSDLCFANSEYLAEFCRKYNPNSFNVGQGCDVDDFLNVTDEIPEDVPKKFVKIIGYVGSLNSDRLDIKIILDVARAYTDYCILLIGPEDDRFKNSELHNLENVFFLGTKPVNELPNYINSIDICINPQIVNEITIGNYPRKIDEYLALGKAIIATSTKTMEFFKDYVYLANNSDDYIKLVQIALQDNDISMKKKRINFALTHTWKQSIQAMSNFVELYEASLPIKD